MASRARKARKRRCKARKRTGRSSKKWINTSTLADRACNRVARFRLGQAKQSRPLSEDLSVSGSARRRLWAQLNAGNLAKVRHRTQVSMTVAAGRNYQQRLSPRRRLVVRFRRKREAQREKEAKRLMVSPEAPREVARLAQRNVARHRGSRKAARENRKKERHRRGHNSSDAIVVATPEPKSPGSLVL
jgi:hypothetical protein